MAKTRNALLLILLCSVAAQAAEPGTLKIRFVGLEDKTGTVAITLANSREVFESDDQSTRSAMLKPTGSSVEAVFEKVPPGTYAAKALHDANDNKEIDIGWRGPTEKYGFSNNVYGLMGPPDYDDAKFDYPGGEMTIEIKAR